MSVNVRHSWLFLAWSARCRLLRSAFQATSRRHSVLAACTDCLKYIILLIVRNLQGMRRCIARVVGLLCIFLDHLDICVVLAEVE